MTAVGQPVESLMVQGGSVPLVVDIDIEPASVLLSTISTAPTVLEIGVAPDQSDVGITFGQFNLSGVAWLGLEFALTGAVFAELPSLSSGGLTATSTPTNGMFAYLPHPVGVGGSSFVDVALDFGGSPSGTLTVTPIVPEPVTAGWLLLATLLLGGRRAG
ncbi:MAG: hypothetical protein AAF800_11225 [Planctomycetota bacterium]